MLNTPLPPAPLKPRPPPPPLKPRPPLGVNPPRPPRPPLPRDEVVKIGNKNMWSGQKHCYSNTKNKNEIHHKVSNNNYRHKELDWRITIHSLPLNPPPLPPPLFWTPPPLLPV